MLFVLPPLAQTQVVPGFAAPALGFQPGLPLPTALAWHVVICFSWHPTAISVLLSADLLPLDRR